MGKEEENDIRLMLQTHMMNSESRAKSIEDIAKRVELALVGDEQMGNPGLVKKVSAHEKKLKGYDTIKNKIIGGALAISGASGIAGYFSAEFIKWVTK